MSLRGSALTVLAAACVAAVAGIGPAAAESTALPGTIDLPCAASTLRQSAEWYLPAGAPRGLVWVQHGFARANQNVAALSESLAAAGYLVFAPSLPFMNLAGCTLQNLGDNTPFLDQVARLFATADDPDGPLARSLAAAAADAGHTAPAMPRQFVFLGHSAGAEAVEYVAHRLHTAAPAAWAGLRGLVLLDPVKSFLGNNTDLALADLDPTGLPILTVSGPPSLCNAFGSGTTALQTLLHRPFLGVRLTTGEHTDAEGASSDLLGEMLCGIPQPANITTVQTLATDWTTDFFDGLIPIQDSASPSSTLLR
ncbi:alpha/beta hydrolase [Nocardia sp. CDC153]|uniref:alpha/beta hydrolase n=1 Tax=Nocardia sp. CDC153 TaxID=3112167 RepID=UPI002DBEA740|nr:alpha/beta hydrolase [Nocardia sp. CDC153]MEC3957735.1 alpha/beta hydrolase [Nocardia sp. CDC153]